MKIAIPLALGLSILVLLLSIQINLEKSKVENLYRQTIKDMENVPEYQKTLAAFKKKVGIEDNK